MPKIEEFHILLHKLLIILTTMHPQKLGYKNTKRGLQSRKYGILLIRVPSAGHYNPLLILNRS